MQVNILVTYIPIDKESDFFVCLVFYLATFSEYQYYLFFYKKKYFLEVWLKNAMGRRCYFSNKRNFPI